MIKSKSAGRKAFIVTNVIIMLLLSALFLFPYLNVLAKALNDPTDLSHGGVWLWPRKFTFANIIQVLQNEGVIYGFQNTLFRVVVGTLTALTVQYTAAYALTRKGLKFKKIIIFYLMMPMYISGGLVSMYIVLGNLGLVNNLFVYVLPGSFSFYNMVIIRTYLMTIPDSLQEAARIDGASELKILLRIMLPLSLPIVATVGLWIAVSHWNDWTSTLYFITSWKKYTLQYNLVQILKESERIQQIIRDAAEKGQLTGNATELMTPEAVEAAQIIISTLPIIAVYPFVQRYFVKGVMIGSVKE